MNREDDEMNGSPPEAEIVQADEAVTDAAPVQVEAAAPVATPKFTVATPALLVAFVLLAIVAAGIFLTKRQLDHAPAQPAPETTDDAAVPPPSFEIPDAAGTPLAGDEPLPAKISNDFGDDLKSAAKGAIIDPAGAEGAIRELPPPPADSDGGLRSMQEAAKEAAKLFSSKPGAAPADIDLSAPGAAEALESLEQAEPPPDSAPQSAPGEKIAPAASPDQTSALRSDVARLEGSLATERQHTERQSAEIARLSAELARLHQEGSPLAQEAARALSFARLENDALSGAAFRPAYDAYAALGGEIPALEPFAEKGLPRLSDLKDEFPPLAREARAAARRALARDPFAKLAANLANLVNLRPAGPRAGDDAAAILSRAEAALARDDLASALDDIGALDPAARAPLASWIEKASLRADAEKALAAKSAAILAAVNAEAAKQ